MTVALDRFARVLGDRRGKLRRGLAAPAALVPDPRSFEPVSEAWPGLDVQAELDLIRAYTTQSDADPPRQAVNRLCEHLCSRMFETERERAVALLTGLCAHPDAVDFSALHYSLPGPDLHRRVARHIRQDEARARQQGGLTSEALEATVREQVRWHFIKSIYAALRLDAPTAEDVGIRALLGERRADQHLRKLQRAGVVDAEHVLARCVGGRVQSWARVLDAHVSGESSEQARVRVQRMVSRAVANNVRNRGHAR